MPTLRKWAATFNVHPGISQIKYRWEEKPLGYDELYVFWLDEIYASNYCVIIDKKTTRSRLHRGCLVVVARGLIINWKQQAYYVFWPTYEDIHYVLCSFSCYCNCKFWYVPVVFVCFDYSNNFFQINYLQVTTNITTAWKNEEEQFLLSLWPSVYL